MIDGYLLALPWIIATLVWAWSGRTTVRFYRYANGHLPLAGALARINAIRFSECLIVSVLLFWLEARPMATVLCYLVASASIWAAVETQHSGSFMHKKTAENGTLRDTSHGIH